jgi:tetratricopeptide (TPR) repeat protein
MDRMNRIPVLAALLLCATFAAPAPARAQEPAPEVLMLELRDGAFRFGTIQSHDPEGFVFVRLDNGGSAHLSWSMLDPRQADELRRRFGYVDLQSEEVTMIADKLTTVDGKEVIGLILDRTPNELLIKQAGSTITLAKDRIAGAAVPIEVPVRSIYTREELYARELAAVPGTDAASNYEIARYCEKVLDFAHAAEHYQKVVKLDPNFHADDLQAALARTAEKAKNSEQLEYLSDVDTLVARRQYDEALARADAFAERFPGSPFVNESKKKHERVLKARDAFLADFVRVHFHECVGRLARNASTKMTYEQTIGYLEATLKTELLAAVTKDVQALTKQLDADAVHKLFAARDRKKLRWERASYGMGTWLLGKERALKGEQPTDPKDAAAKAPTDNDKKRAALNEQIKRFLQNREMVAKSKSDGEQTEDREAFWREFSSAGRSQWILAYFAEYGGEFDVSPKPLFDNCRECGGTGVRIISLAGANVAQTQGNKPTATEEKKNCEACHGLGRVRRISYR